MATELEAHAQEERDNGKILYPPQEQIFRALQLTKPEDVRVCLVGQDPYHTPGQANGLAFSIAPGNPLQPSLVNIFKELEEDVGIKRPESGDLTKWAENGVLLLNTSLIKLIAVCDGDGIDSLSLSYRQPLNFRSPSYSYCGVLMHRIY